jgi:hypothetical protein
MSLASRLADLITAIGADIKNINLKKNRDRVYTNATATGTVTLNLALYDIFELTLTGNTTLAFSNAPTLSGEAIAPVVSITCGATGYTTTWMSGISLWLTPGGTAPAGPAAGKTGEFIFTSKNGTTWTGRKGSAT